MSQEQEPLALAIPSAEVKSSEDSYRLQHLEVFNWGPFKNFHRAEFDKDGTAIIGPTGSGKTTLVDALMTLLVFQPRYNLASTGGHESDRTLISYVRGVLGGDGSNGREEVARPGKTITGICATYLCGDQTLRLGGLLWTEGTSNSQQDLKRRWIFSQAADQSLGKWLTLLHEDGVRQLMKLGRETAGLRIFESKPTYLAHIRKFFDVGENAFTLLNRAAGLKQLNSIDEIFRDLVLDDRSAFDRALGVAGEFDNLAEIHAELELARRQQASLAPVAEENRKLQQSRTKLQRLETLKRIIPVWYAIAGEKLWQRKLERIVSEKREAEVQLQVARQDEQDCQDRVQTLQERYLELGGNVITELQDKIDLQRRVVSERKKHADNYCRMVATHGLDQELSQSALLRNQVALAPRRQKIQEQHDERQEATLEALSRQREQQAKIDEMESQIRKVKDRPGSNIPPRYQDFRDHLANHLGMQDRDLPFLAELVEVKPEQNGWRGAIERAIGSERLRILVPEDQLRESLRWINARDNRLHVWLQEAQQNEKPSHFFPDGFVRKLNFKHHPLQSTAQKMLASRDLHCVDSTETLQKTEHGLTIEGMMSGRRGRFEKHDQRPLHENWLTGFDNKDQLEALTRELSLLRNAIKECESKSLTLRRELAELESQLTMIDQLLNLDFAKIDLPGAESELARSQQRLNTLIDPKSDASQAKVDYELEREKLHKIREQISQCQTAIAVLDDRYANANRERNKAVERIGHGLSEEDSTLAKQKLPLEAEVEAENLADAERTATDHVNKKLDDQKTRINDQEKRLVRLMEIAKHKDSGALAEAGSDLEDVDAYLERLRVLNDEALPEKLNRFLDYLNRSSDQGVTQLLAGIAEEVDAIEQRIAELNQTLVKVDFHANRYLQLQPQRITHERLRALETAMRKLRSAALKEDQGESQYTALRELVEILRDAGENRRKQGSRALLDPRYRLQFFVVEVDRKTGDRSPPRTGSQSGSGGEKELMASHILTASLSYALCPAEANCPLYGTVVLDEAFSKSSPSAAGRIIEALRIFRLHPIFVTPNKEIGLLKQHTRKVICVQRPNKEASLASISWETLEELANP